MKIRFVRGFLIASFALTVLNYGCNGSPPDLKRRLEGIKERTEKHERQMLDLMESESASLIERFGKQVQLMEAAHDEESARAAAKELHSARRFPATFTSGLGIETREKY